MFFTIKSFFSKTPIRTQASIITVLHLISGVSALLISIIIARTLGPGLKGTYDLFAVILFFIVEVGTLGIGNGLLYYISRKEYSLPQVHGTGLLFSIVNGIITFLIGVCGLPAWRKLLPGLEEWIILMAFAAAGFLYYRTLMSYVFLGIDRPQTPFIITSSGFVLKLVGALCLLFFNSFTIRLIIYLMFAVAIVEALLSLILLYRINQNLFEFKFSLLKSASSYGAILFAAHIANFFIFKIDQIMINYWNGAENLGLYTVSVQLAEILFILDIGLTSSAVYKISSSSMEEGRELAHTLFIKFSKISVSAGILLAIFAAFLVNILYGKQFAPSALPLIILIPGIVLWSSTKFISNYISYNIKKGSFLTWCSLTGFAINIALNFIFIKIMDLNIIGAAIASTISYIIVCLLILNYFYFGLKFQKTPNSQKA